MKKPDLKFLNLPMKARSGKILSQLKVFLLPIITVFALFFVLIVAGPRVPDIIELSKSVKTLDQKRLVLEEKVKALSSLDSSSLKSKVQQSEKALPSQKDVPGILFATEKLASDNGVSITSIQLTPGEITATSSAATAVSKLPIRLTVAGGYDGIKNFLSQAIVTNRIMKVLRATLTSGSTASISAALEVETYFLPLDTVRFKFDDPLPNLTQEEEKALERSGSQPDFSQLPSERPPTGGRPNPFERF